MNEKDKETLDLLKNKIETFFQENKNEAKRIIYKYNRNFDMKEHIGLLVRAKFEDFYCCACAFGTILFSKSGDNLEELFKAATKFLDDRNKLLKEWQHELKITQGILKHAEEIYNWNDLKYMQSETKSLSKTKFTHHEFIPNYAEVSDIKWFLEHDNGANYFSLTYGHHYLLNIVVDTNKHIIGAIGTFKNTFLFEDYSASLESLLEDSKVRFNKHSELIYEANSQKERK